MMLQLVVAMCSKNRGIGINNNLPWKLKGDMEFFKNTTMRTSKPGLKNAVVMGRKTWDSIPEKMKPLRNRLNVILSRSLEMPSNESVHVARSFEEVVDWLETNKDLENVFVIGGSGVFEMALDHKSCHRIYLTEVLKEFECDTFFPQFDANLFVQMRLPWIDSSLKEEGDVKYKITCYQKICQEIPLSDLLIGTKTYLVAAMDDKRGIGFEGHLPWPSLSKDYTHYTGLLRGEEGSPTVGIIGRTSWESMTSEEKNLPHVLYVVVSKTRNLEDYPECCCVVKSFDLAIRVASCLVENEKAAKICYLGGHNIYKDAVNNNCCERIYLTRIQRTFPSDVFFPSFEHLYVLDDNTNEDGDHRVTLEEDNIRFKFEEYKLKN